MMNTMNTTENATATETATLHTQVAHVVSYEACLPRLAKVQRKAVRLGCPLPSLTLLARDEVVECVNAEGRKFKVALDRVALEYGDLVLAGGWRLLAQVDHDLGEGNAVLRCVRGAEVPGTWAESSGFECDHCGKAMRRRNTYIVASETEGLRRVGGNCLRDFLGLDATKALAYLKLRLDAEDLLGLDDAAGSENMERRILDLEEVLAMTSCAMRECGGYVSRAKSDELGCMSTATMIRESYAKNGRVTLEPVQSDLDLAAIVAEWMLALNERDEPSNYIESLATYGRAGVVNWRGIGIAASAVAAYQREQSEVVLRKGRASVHVGTVGEKLDFLGKVVGLSHIDSQYGTSTLYVFAALEHEDSAVPAGAIVKYFSSRDLQREDGESLQRGDELWLLATVKKHVEYQGTAQTMVTRGDVVDSPAVRAARIAKLRAEKEAEKAAEKAAKAAARDAARAEKAAAKAAEKAAAKAAKAAAKAGQASMAL
jgi:hypothetical protein